MPLPGPDSSFHFEHLRKVILILDTVESVRLMERDEAGFIERWHQFIHDARHVVAPACEGRYRKSTGDGFLLEFDEAAGAVEAAFELGRRAQRANAPVGREFHMHVRIAVHLADYVADEFDIYGAGVNVASRLLSLAGPGDILVSDAVRDLLQGTGARLEDLGLHQLRHLSTPAHVFRMVAWEQAGRDIASRPQTAGRPDAHQRAGSLRFRVICRTPSET